MTAASPRPVWLLQALFGWLHLALTAPSVYLWLGLPLVMRQHGWSGTAIGLFQLAGLPALIKFALAAPVEARSANGQPRYRAWALALCLAYAAVLLALGWQQLLAERLWLFGLAFAAALAATWADIPVNALAIRLLPASERMRAGGVRAAALSLGAIVGGGLMLLMQAKWGWRAPFLCLAGALALGALLLAWVVRHEPGDAPSPLLLPAPKAGLAAMVRGYGTQPGAWRWTLALVSYFPFIGAAWFYLKPLMLDHGFAPAQAALLAGMGGGVVAALAGAASPLLTRRLGTRRALPLYAGCNVAALALLAAVIAAGAPAPGLIAAVACVAAAMGASSACVFGLMMQFARPRWQAFDYGLQASLFAASRMLVPLAAGVALDAMGAAAMLTGLTVAAALAWVWALRCAGDGWASATA
ncbi:MFS transporter [Delftia sp. CH05]|uniref:MFS transporter n=1 Tax=Delftia sp. CH05 TaxID=2692194 RepID=UPI00135D1989|nr:MFS transporter [Delftia sp. CH05]MXN27824.1 MFS transporter [Delftia sp. CH05]